MGKTLIVKVGSEEMGWIPSKKYYDEIEQKLIDSGVLKNFEGHIVTHWATNFEVIDTDTMQVQKSEPETEILKDEKYCKCESVETGKDGNNGTITVTEYKQEQEYHLYSIYWDYAFRYICSKCTKDKEKELKEYFIRILPAGSYVFNCDWEYKYVIMCPLKLTDSYIKLMNLNTEQIQFCNTERFKKIADYEITKEEKADWEKSWRSDV